MSDFDAKYYPRYMFHNPFLSTIKPYLDYLASFTENLADQSVKHGASTGEIARDYLSDPSRLETFTREFPKLCGYVISFWQKHLPYLLTEIEKVPGLRARFGGDIGPQIEKKLYERLGIYFDSVIVPDPLLRTVTAPVVDGPYFFLKYATNLTLTRDLFLSDVYPPIAILVGEQHLIRSDSYFKELGLASQFDSVLLSNQLFGRQFNDFDEVDEFVSSFNSDDELISEMADPSLLYIDETVGKTPEEQLAEADRMNERLLPKEMRPTEFFGPRRVLYQHIHGRMMQVNSHLMGAGESIAHPVIQAEVTFHWLQSKLKANAAIMSEALQTDLLVQLPLTNGLLSENLEWLANVPLEDLIRLREKGFLGELRELIGKNVTELAAADLYNLSKISSDVDYNLNTALNLHQEKIQLAHTEALDGVLTATPSLLVGISGMVLPLFGIIEPVLLLGATALLGKFTVKDLLPGIMKLKRERETLEKTPVGILWSAHEKTEKK